MGFSLLNGSVLYVLAGVARAPERAAPTAAAMGLASLVAAPAWWWVRERVGARRQWLAAVVLAVAATAAYAGRPAEDAAAAQAFCVALQVAMLGLVFAFWALLPDVCPRDGVDAAGGATLGYGVAAFLQKLGAGAGTALLSGVYALAGYRPALPQTAAVRASMHAVLLLGPVAALLVSAVVVLAAPGLDSSGGGQEAEGTADAVGLG